MNAGQISKLISFNYCFHVEEVVIFLLKLVKANLLNKNFRQISNFLILYIYQHFLSMLYLAQVFVFRGFLKTSHSALNGQVIREGIFQRHGLQSSIENCLKSTNNSQNASLFRCICILNCPI